MTTYVITTPRGLAMAQGPIDADAYVAGPYATTDDAEAALIRRTIVREARRSAVWSLALVAVMFAAVWVATHG